MDKRCVSLCSLTHSLTTITAHQIFTKSTDTQEICANHKQALCTFHQADAALVREVRSSASPTDDCS